MRSYPYTWILRYYRYLWRDAEGPASLQSLIHHTKDVRDRYRLTLEAKKNKTFFYSYSSDMQLEARIFCSWIAFLNKDHYSFEASPFPGTSSRLLVGKKVIVDIRVVRKKNARPESRSINVTARLSRIFPAPFKRVSLSRKTMSKCSLPYRGYIVAKLCVGDVFGDGGVFWKKDYSKN